MPYEYLHSESVFRLRFSDLLAQLNTDPVALPELCFATLGPDAPTHPVSERYIGFDELQRPTKASAPMAERQGPENWFYWRYNQPLDIAVYYVRGARSLPGGVSSPDYSQNHWFEGRRLGFHKGAGCLLLSDGRLFPGSFALQDSHRSLPAGRFSFENGHFRELTTLPSARHAVARRGLHYYLGSLLPHWGHFLLDGLPRLWLLNKLSEESRQKLTFVCLDNHMPSWGWALLAPFGITPENTVFAKEHTSFEHLIVPMESYKTHIAAHTEFQSTMDNIRAYYAEDSSPNRRVFLSRKHQASRFLENESELEAFMEGLGFDVVVPEALSVADQVKLAANASVLAGGTGSGMYLAAFQAIGTKTLIFAPKTFLLFDDYIQAAVGKRHISFVIGGPHVIDSENRWKSHWHLNLNEDLRREITCFVYS